MVKEPSHKLVITLPMDTYFKLRELAGELPMNRYIELLLRNVAVREVKLGGLRKGEEVSHNFSSVKDEE